MINTSELVNVAASKRHLNARDATSFWHLLSKTTVVFHRGWTGRAPEYMQCI